MSDILLVIILASIGVSLLWVFWNFAYRPYMDKIERANPRFIKDNNGEEHERNIGPRKCPVCGETLATGMSIKSKVFKQGTTDKIMQIYGCPYCYPTNQRFLRICPVCNKEIPAQGYLLARYFEKLNHRHVHVLGCTLCRRG